MPQIHRLNLRYFIVFRKSGSTEKDFLTLNYKSEFANFNFVIIALNIFNNSFFVSLFFLTLLKYYHTKEILNTNDTLIIKFISHGKIKGR